MTTLISSKHFRYSEFLQHIRKTNTYAKKKKRLQQRLDVYWILHNFVRVHFTTKHVPAVALGIIEQGLSLAEIFSIPCVWN